jgi:transcriptional regulator with XRE-family HTH domain
MMDRLPAEQLGARLHRTRVERGLSLRQAAAQTGVTKETLSDLERGRRTPHPPTLAKIAKGYGVEISDLLGPMVEEEPALAGKAKAPPSPEQPPLNGFLQEEERRIIPHSAESLKMHIEQMKRLKELRTADTEEIKKGFGPRNALVFQMEMADKGLRALLEEMGVLGFAEAVRAGRVMAEPAAIPLCHELSRRLQELEALSAEARVSSVVASSDIREEAVKGAAQAESWAQEESERRRRRQA